MTSHIYFCSVLPLGYGGVVSHVQRATVNWLGRINLVKSVPSICGLIKLYKVMRLGTILCKLFPYLYYTHKINIQPRTYIEHIGFQVKLNGDKINVYIIIRKIDVMDGIERFFSE